ncbi:MAG: response regulator, partial [Candidatus Aminicenantes bacterium]|nr:response regulator [Candidatus Aminicenantes bacterium]
MKKNQTIHVIDDEPIIHEVLGELLTSEGYNVDSSANGEEALEKHTSKEYDLVLLDLLMPGMNGIDVLKE